MAYKSDWASHLREADSFREKRMIAATKKGSPAQRAFATAGLIAYQGMVQDGLVPQRTEDMEARYAMQKGLVAAAHGRQEAAATLLIQSAALHRLDGLRELAWAAVVLLAYIAIRVTV